MDQLLFSLTYNLWNLVSFRSWLMTLASSRSSWARSAFYVVVNFWLWNLLHGYRKISWRCLEFPLTSVFQRGPWACFDGTRKADCDSKATEHAGERGQWQILLTRLLGGMTTMPIMPLLAMWLSHLLIRFDTCMPCRMTLTVAGGAFTAERCRAPGSATLRKQERRKFFDFLRFPLQEFCGSSTKICSEEDLACS